jgi:hypothetical protein
MSVVDRRGQRSGEDRFGEDVQFAAHRYDDTLGAEPDVEFEIVHRSSTPEVTGAPSLVWIDRLNWDGGRTEVRTRGLLVRAQPGSGANGLGGRGFASCYMRMVAVGNDCEQEAKVPRPARRSGREPPAAFDGT